MRAPAAPSVPNPIRVVATSTGTRMDAPASTTKMMGSSAPSENEAADTTAASSGLARARGDAQLVWAWADRASCSVRAWATCCASFGRQPRLS